MNQQTVRSARGFSLPEVTIAVAIAALGILAILGLLPQGLEMTRKTSEISAHRHILEQVFRDLEQTTWTALDKVTNAGPYKRWFDDQGLETTQGGSTLTYTVQVELFGENKGTTKQKPRLPGASNLSGDSASQKYLLKTIVKIAATANPGFDFSDTNSPRFALYVNYLAKGR